MTRQRPNQHDLTAQARLRAFLDEVFRSVLAAESFEMRLREAVAAGAIPPRLAAALLQGVHRLPTKR